jgi:hypothetical protein
MHQLPLLCASSSPNQTHNSSMLVDRQAGTDWHGVATVRSNCCRICVPLLLPGLTVWQIFVLFKTQIRVHNHVETGMHMCTSSCALGLVWPARCTVIACCLFACCL